MPETHPLPKSYRTPAAIATGRVVEKKSEFLSLLAPCRTEGEALAVLAQAKAEHRTARHHVYAYLLRAENRQRYSDDGEPAGTAGLPVLGVLTHADVTDCILVVTRYFGGTLLGTGGLVRAYTAAATAALSAADIRTIRPMVTLDITLAYPEYEPARRILAAAGAAIHEPVFTDTVCFSATLPAGTEAPVLADLHTATRGSIDIACRPAGEA